jgi:hypothetical protein
MKFALALLTRDHPELTRRSIEPLLQPDKFDLFWIDGSATKEGLDYLRGDSGAMLQTLHPRITVHGRIRGGADAAIVFALTQMLAYDYTHIGLVEQDVLLHPDWFGPTKALFELCRHDGLEVGAVSARSYEDRVLIQRDGYAVMHNLGAGMVILTRKAAQIILANYRTAWAPDNRLIFSQLSGIDIGKYWAFRGNERWLSADWNFDAILARHGLASLALTPSLATMLDQDIAAQGLKMAQGDGPRNDDAFSAFKYRTNAIRHGDLMPGISGRLCYSSGGYTVFPHQIAGLGGTYTGDWILKWSQGFGPFAWKAGDRQVMEYPPTLELSVLGQCEFMVSGGKHGGKVELVDEQSGYYIKPELLPEGPERQILTLPVPGGCNYRTIRLTALTPGVTFYGLRTVHPQPWHPPLSDFDHSKLPRVE